MIIASLPVCRCAAPGWVLYCGQLQFARWLSGNLAFNIFLFMGPMTPSLGRLMLIPSLVVATARELLVASEISRALHGAPMLGSIDRSVSA